MVLNHSVLAMEFPNYRRPLPKIYGIAEHA